MSKLSQIFNTVNIGLVILDRNLRVQEWNRWMTQQSGVAEKEILGASILEFFPSLDSPVFNRNCKSVLTFGNFAFFSQKLHGHLFPLPPPHLPEARFEFMQQSCTMGPIRDDEGAIESIFLIVQDVTELALFEGKLLEMNVKDELTGIHNRRYLDKRLEDEFQRSRRYCKDLSLIVFDIDFFKKVNDTHGHQCGDLILQNVAARIASSIRKTDCIARYGGEEFCCLLPETELKAAFILAERFRREIEEMVSSYDGQSIRVTISLGVTELDGRTNSSRQLFHKADEALYHAKNTGRNRVASLSQLPSENITCEC